MASYSEYMLRFHLDADCPRPSLARQRWNALKETIERGSAHARAELGELWLSELGERCGDGRVLEGGTGIGFAGEAGRVPPWHILFTPARAGLRDARDILFALRVDASGESHGRVFAAAGAAIDAFAILAQEHSPVIGSLELIRAAPRPPPS